MYIFIIFGIMISLWFGLGFVLQIREDVKTGVYVDNLTEEYVCSMKDIIKLLTKVCLLQNLHRVLFHLVKFISQFCNEGLEFSDNLSITIVIYHGCCKLLQGLANRRTGATSINAESSRSHSVFTCVVESRCKVFFVT